MKQYKFVAPKVARDEMVKVLVNGSSAGNHTIDKINSLLKYRKPSLFGGL
ncbi:hypothetical protein L1999_15585 [Neobacillus drentensis]|nr:hypothetical protein [Neobacillus drentensis]ULT54583.1 hypothetical protein L1999_15585 [Neobacillus drentensis]